MHSRLTAAFGRTLVTLPVLMTLAACDDDPVTARRQPPSGPVAVVTTTDFSSGELSTVSLDSTHQVHTGVSSVHSDAVVRVFDGLVYVVNRYLGDNIQVLDPDDDFAVVRQFSVGNGSDPHDIVVVSAARAYVTRYNETDLWVVDPSTGNHVGSVDLSTLADADGIPEMDQLAAVGGNVYVTLERVDRNTLPWEAPGASFVAVIEAGADTLLDTDAATPGTQPITLANANPFSTLQLDPDTGNLYVACVGKWSVSDAGVESLSPVTMTTTGTILTGTAAGGDITDVEVVSAERGYAIVTDAAFATSLLAFDPRSGAVIDTVYAPGTFSLQDVEMSAGGELFLADRSPTAPGIRIYDAATGTEKTAAPVDVGLPPFSIAFRE